MAKDDKIDDLRKKLQNLSHNFNILKNVGINEEVLIAYIHYKTKLPIGDIKEMIKSYEDFHRNLINEEVLKTLEKELGNGEEKK